jgi:hypothetical protein
MSPSDLKIAMQVSRMTDFYYNAPSWQKVIRDMIGCNKEFIMKFTRHLSDIMVLDSPLSQERRGIILYEYCKLHHPEKLTDVSVAWIEAGHSLKKEPAGDVIKIKNLEGYLAEHQAQMNIAYGTAEASHRYFLLTSSGGRIIFGYDSQIHQPEPVFRAEIDL